MSLDNHNVYCVSVAIISTSASRVIGTGGIQTVCRLKARFMNPSYFAAANDFNDFDFEICRSHRLPQTQTVPPPQCRPPR